MTAPHTAPRSRWRTRDRLPLSERQHHAHSASRPILIVEDNAHSAVGHYPELFAELASAVQDLGYPVAVLSSRGWVLKSDPSFASLEAYEFGALASATIWCADALSHLAPHRFWRLVSNVPRSAAIIGAARARRRRLGGAVVVATGRGVHPLVGAMLAGRGRWLFYRFDAPSKWLAGETTPDARFRSIRALSRRLALSITRTAERSRERQGGAVAVVVHNDVVRNRWARVAPWLSPVAVPFATCRTQARMPNARAELGIEPSMPVALVFGSSHFGKNLETVWRAFAELPEWQLVVAGEVADTYREWASSRGDLDPRPIQFDGYVDRRTRALVYSASDLTILSFKRGITHDSATLTDSLTWGVAVVCSDGCPAAEFVERHGIGKVFRSGDVESLTQAVRQAPRTIPTDALHGARDELSADRTAGRIVALIEGDGE